MMDLIRHFVLALACGGRCLY
uniref:Uncharacterized protein n=1 Tax=Arundo donax TaxID=35708 RepID=A0A0A9AX58_ARUDO